MKTYKGFVLEQRWCQDTDQDEPKFRWGWRKRYTRLFAPFPSKRMAREAGEQRHPRVFHYVPLVKPKSKKPVRKLILLHKAAKEKVKNFDKVLAANSPKVKPLPNVELTDLEAAHLLSIEEGCDVYGYHLAGSLRGMQRRGLPVADFKTDDKKARKVKNPLFHLVDAMQAPKDGTKQQPYFGAKATAYGIQQAKRRLGL